MKINVYLIEKVAKSFLAELAKEMQNDESFVYEACEAISDVAELAGYSLDDLWLDDGGASGLLYLIDEVVYGLSIDMGIYEVWA